MLAWQVMTPLLPLWMARSQLQHGASSTHFSVCSQGRVSVMPSPPHLSGKSLWPLPQIHPPQFMLSSPPWASLPFFLARFRVLFQDLFLFPGNHPPPLPATSQGTTSFPGAFAICSPLPRSPSLNNPHQGGQDLFWWPLVDELLNILIESPSGEGRWWESHQQGLQICAKQSHRLDNTFRRAGLCSSLPAELEVARDQVLLGIIGKIKGTMRSIGCENCCWGLAWVRALAFCSS